MIRILLIAIVLLFAAPASARTFAADFHSAFISRPNFCDNLQGCFCEDDVDGRRADFCMDMSNGATACARMQADELVNQVDSDCYTFTNAPALNHWASEPLNKNNKSILYLRNSGGTGFVRYKTAFPVCTGALQVCTVRWVASVISASFTGWGSSIGFESAAGNPVCVVQYDGSDTRVLAGTVTTTSTENYAAGSSNVRGYVLQYIDNTPLRFCQLNIYAVNDFDFWRGVESDEIQATGD